jgi:N6-adenosine-specific RNA methylase IME4
MSAPMMKVSAITVGSRHRRDLGDIDALARTISEDGLLHPIVVSPDGTLIAGERRLEAVKRLGWESIPVTVVELDEIARGEFAENAHRKDFLPSEIDAIRRTLEPHLKAEARDRMSEARKVGKVSTPSRARDKIGAFAGVSGRTVEKISQVCEAAEADPGRFGKLKADMDRTGRVNGVHKRLKVMRQDEAIRAEPPPLPNRGPYRVIVADAPWPYEARQQDPSHRGSLPYPPMSIAQICAMPVASIAHEDCILWLWVTNAHMREAFEVIDAWGFEQKSILTWIKDQMGIGNWLRGQTEHCMLAVRGKPTVVLTNQTTALHASRGAHSEKPDAFFDLVEALCPAPRYAYLFSRSARTSWDGHGDEYPGHRVPDVGALADVIDQVPRVHAEVDAAERDDGIPAFLDRRKKPFAGRVS